MPFPPSQTLFGRVAPAVGAVSVCAALRLAASPSASAPPTYTVRHPLAGGSGDGATPLYAGWILDGAGNLDGTTGHGGSASPCENAALRPLTPHQPERIL
jgi:hypothetical protein